MVFNTQGWRLQLTAIICAALLVPGDVPLGAQQPAPPPSPSPSDADSAKVRSSDELDSLVAPIALYPDSLLAQVLAASTYPLEIVQCRRWLDQNQKLKGEALAKAVAKQPWDPSVQGLVTFPDVLKRMDEGLQWATDLGNAFLEQPSDVMDAVQRMRKKAKDGGKLESSKEQKVEVQTVENKSVIVIQPSNPEVVYVPSYNPTVVYGAPPAVYAYPPVAYPPYPTGAVVATAAISFGVGMAMGAMWGGGGCCGYGASWGGNANINVNNNFNVQGGNRTNVSGGNRANVGSGNVGSGNRAQQWNHNPQHRGNAPYGNRQTAQRYGGAARDSAGQTQRFGQGRQARGSQTGRESRGVQASARDMGGNRGSAGAADRSRGGGGQDRVGGRSFDSGSRGGDRSAFGGGSGSKAASSRGASSSRSSGGFGGSGGGGGARRGGGGGRRGR